MNEIQINELTQKFQVLSIQNKMPAFRNFKNEIYSNFLVFSFGRLEKIYVFIETIQKHPKRGALPLALKPMFKMLLSCMIDRCDVVKVYHMKTGKTYNIEYKNIFTHFKRKKLVSFSYKSYLIPFKKKCRLL